MIVMLVDMIIYLLLAVGVVFGGIGIIGLMLFPDIRSRMFTGIRATLISCSAIFLAGVIYGLFNLFTRGGIQYTTFTIITILFLLLIVFLNRVAAQKILRQTSEMNRILASGTTESGERTDPVENQ